MGYIVKGVSDNGNVQYVTGRAGFGFLDPVQENAFEYPTKEQARRKAYSFNKMVIGATYRFVAVCPDPEERKD